jgi:hypothetical protein
MPTRLLDWPRSPDATISSVKFSFVFRMNDPESDILVQGGGGVCFSQAFTIRSSLSSTRDGLGTNPSGNRPLPVRSSRSVRKPLRVERQAATL